MILSAERIDSLFTRLLLRVLRRERDTQVYYITLDKREDLGEILLCDERGEVCARLIDGIRCRRKLFLVPAAVPDKAILRYGVNEFKTFTDAPRQLTPSAASDAPETPAAFETERMPEAAIPVPSGNESAANDRG